jgi:hypothetical protein
MFGIRAFLFGTAVGAGAGYFALNYHVVHGPDGPFVVSRTEQPPIRSAYVDVRNWSAAMWRQHPEVTAALIKAGHSDVIASSALSSSLSTESASPIPAPAWPTLDVKSGFQSKTEQGLNSLLESVPPIQFEDDSPSAAPVPSTIPSQTKRVDDDSLDVKLATGASAKSIPTAQVGQLTEEMLDKAKTSLISLGPAPGELSTIPPGMIEQELKTILGEPAPIPGAAATPVTSTIPPTAQNRPVPEPNNSAVEAFKSLFSGAATGEQSAMPPSNRAIKTKAF